MPRNTINSAPSTSIFTNVTVSRALSRISWSSVTDLTFTLSMLPALALEREACPSFDSSGMYKVNGDCESEQAASSMITFERRLRSTLTFSCFATEGLGSIDKTLPESPTH